MRRFLPVTTCLALLLGTPLLHAEDAAKVEIERASKGTVDASIAPKLDAKGTPYTVDEDGDYRILVDVGEGRSQLVWVRSKVHTTDFQRVREVWTYGFRSDERRIPVHIANRLLTENFELILGAWAREGGNAILLIKIDADASADILNEAIDLAASTGDRMEQKLVSGDEL